MRIYCRDCDIYLQRITGQITKMRHKRFVYRNLRFLKQLTFYEGVAVRDLETLPQLPKLENVTLFSPFESRSVQVDAPVERLRPEQLERLATIRTESLEIYDELVLVEDLQQLLSVARFKELVLGSPAITAEELTSLRATFPQIAIKAYWESSDQPPANQAAMVKEVRQSRERRAGKRVQPPTPQ